MDKLSIAAVWATITVWLTYLGIKEEIFFLFLFLLSLDFFTWIAKWFIHSDVKSSTVTIWLIKKVSILFVILWTAVLLKILDFDPTLIDTYIYVLFWAFSMVELYSVIWNTYSIHYGVKISEFDALKMLLTSISFVLEKGITSKLNEINIKEEKKENTK